MLELIVIALVSTAVAIALVWLWRKMTEFKGATMASLSSNRKTELKLTSQQGYVDLPSSMAQRAVLSKKASGNAKPWGW